MEVINANATGIDIGSRSHFVAVGHGIHKFETAKLFAFWLRLSPNNKISGGKLLSNKIPKGSNRLIIALRNAANAIGNLKPVF